MATCQQCKTETLNPKFCSLRCATTHQAQVRSQQMQAPQKECLSCGKIFEYGRYSGTSRTSQSKFCDRGCAASYNNRIVPKRKKSDIKLPRCRGCNNAVKRMQSTYCSSQCNSTHKKELRIAKWLGGDSSVATDAWGLSKWAREYLLAEANYTCSVCRWDERHPVDNLPTVQPDHIDGNAMNNVKSNLQVLCPNHHSVTPFHGARNRGNGREARRITRNKIAKGGDTLDKDN